MIKSKIIRRTILFEFLKFHYRYWLKNSRLKGRTIVITGALGGIGIGLSTRFAQKGCKVIGVDIVPPEAISDDVKDVFSKYYQFDLSQVDKVEAFIHSVIEENDAIDILVNNAAIMNFQLLQDYSTKDILDMYNVKLISATILIKVLLKHMSNNNFGRIINVSSTSAYKGEDKFGVYAPLNSGTLLLADSVSRLIDNKMDGDLTINAIIPHRVATPEYLKLNPEIKEKRLISLSRVFKKVERIVSSEVNGGYFPIFPFHLRINYLIRTFLRLFLT